MTLPDFVPFPVVTKETLWLLTELIVHKGNFFCRKPEVDSGFWQKCQKPWSCHRRMLQMAVIADSQK